MMTITRENMIELKVRLLKDMNDYIHSCDDMVVIERWKEQLDPRYITDGFLRLAASNEDFWKETVYLFGNLTAGFMEGR